MSEEGKCPKCQCENLNYGVFELQDDEGFYPFECLNCGFTGRAWYKLKFDAMTDEEGEEV